MGTTSSADEFDKNATAKEVASKFRKRIPGKNVIVTGGNTGLGKMI